MQSNFISLESIQIATPCRAEWNAMQRVQGSDCTRFCPSCGKNVYNLSAMTRDEATRLIQQKEGKMCVRLHRRSDGTVLTSDCPVGQSASRKRSRFAQLFAAVVGLGAALFGMSHVLANRSNDAPEVLTGVSFTAGQNLPLPSQTEHHGNASGDAPGADITTH